MVAKRGNVSLAILMAIRGKVKRGRRWSKSAEIREQLEEKGVEVHPAYVVNCLDSLISHDLVQFREIPANKRKEEKGKHGRKSIYEFSTTSQGEEVVDTLVSLAK
jgi:hypothetical protein